MEAIDPLLLVLSIPMILQWRVLVLNAVGWIGFAVIIIADWRTATSWQRERELR